MRKFLVGLGAVFVCCIAFGDTLNVTWMDGDSVHDTSTCTVGNTLVLPTPPTKRGYTFVGWGTSGVITGTQAVSAPGTQTPTNPIFPVFTPFGTDVLRAFNINGNLVADTYDTATGILTQYFGVKIFDGTEDWQSADANSEKIRFGLNKIFLDARGTNMGYVTHWPNTSYANDLTKASIGAYIDPVFTRMFVVVPTSIASSLSEFKAWLATQYQNGTPVTVYYVLSSPIVTNWNPN